ncbi:hypothetical protein Ahy_A02g007315 [Arachis hypogaea]|uniref:Uncharacterized protein n=1 Tax=Arachis hypogaea TaxID=3818 RepID=A0A445EBY6_ARAHY|nr:hypothetical protein Ahy_A02g007315 [Arachis hypogaea]
MGLYQGSENWTRPAGSTGLIANRRCKQSGPPLITAGEKIDELAKNRPVKNMVSFHAVNFIVNFHCVVAVFNFIVLWVLLISVIENSINQEATADNNAFVNNNRHVDPPISNDDAANPNSRSANDSQSQGSSNLRGKIDLAWKYVALQTVNGKPQYQYLFCLQVFNGDGIHRMKKYLAKITGDVKKCPKVSYDVEKQMKSLLKEIQTNKKKKKSEIDADLYQSGGGSSSLYATSLDSSTQQSGNEGEDHPTEADLQQVLAEFDN